MGCCRIHRSSGIVVAIAVYEIALISNKLRWTEGWIPVDHRAGIGVVVGNSIERRFLIRENEAAGVDPYTDVEVAVESRITEARVRREGVEPNGLIEGL